MSVHVEHLKGKLRSHRSKSKKLVAKMMREVHTNIPSTVTRANVSGARREKMLQAIAFSKARSMNGRRHLVR